MSNKSVLDALLKLRRMQHQTFIVMTKPKIENKLTVFVRPSRGLLKYTTGRYQKKKATKKTWFNPNDKKKRYSGIYILWFDTTGNNR